MENLGGCVIAYPSIDDGTFVVDPTVVAETNFRNRDPVLVTESVMDHYDTEISL